MRKLDRAGASMYVSEIRDLVDSILFRIHLLEGARAKWVAGDNTASAHASADHDTFDLEAFNAALNEAAGQQPVIFDLFEALLTSWARLSLLFFPVGGGAKAQWRQRRGEVLRDLLMIPSVTLLADRGFRDAWMHVDERMDDAFQANRLGNRQCFSNTADVPARLNYTLRVIDVEALAFHYWTQSGQTSSVAIAKMKAVAQQLLTELGEVGKRVVQHPDLA